MKQLCGHLVFMQAQCLNEATMSEAIEQSSIDLTEVDMA